MHTRPSMSEGIVTIRVEVPRWAEAEIAAVKTEERVAIWRSADWQTDERPTHVTPGRGVG
jgi:hypothetical protein